MPDKFLLNRGLECIATGDFSEATEKFRQAIAADPDDAEAYNCLGAVQYKLNLFTEAESSLRQSLEHNPKNPDALCNLGALFISSQRLETAQTYLEQLIQIRPDYPAAYNNLGFIQMQKGLFSEAKLSFRRVIELNPHSPDAYNNLGLIQTQEGSFEKAEASFRRSLELNPKFPDACNNLGIVLKYLHRRQEATYYFQQALRLNPLFPAAYNSLGTILTETGRHDLAEQCFRRAIRLNPDYPDPYHNLGVLFTNLNHLAQAEDCFRQALALNPRFTDAEFSLATLYLLQARYEEGWEKYDKSRMIKHRQDQPDIPRWQGESLSGKKILLYYEQGFGDTLHFVRYAHWVKKLSAQTVLWVQKPLRRLIAASFPRLEVYGIKTIHERSPEGFDFSCPLPSLPRVFNTSSASVPRKIPYINVYSEIVDRWKKTVGRTVASNRYKVGVAWAGNPNHHNDCNRSIPLDTFANLFAANDVAWFSLQAEVSPPDLAKFPSKVFHQPGQFSDFAETAGLIIHLDLIITVDSAVAHLAGALGKNTWLLLPFAPDWRWQSDRENTPWYPTLRLFRQNRIGDWSEVLTRVKGALSQQLQTSQR
ncbi:MAG TPA: tetratricopeptide repeat protein [Patescibacteria group bacterium]|nr:tetratricopeptide repeat protein [Patescibacteria group bacterium]